MSFPQSVKIEELTASARHCCVCHRYKGLKIEVHHIIQETNGGPDTAENAIALCFDCHADAGHYNDKHPKGTKYSIPELKKHKEKWHKIVKEHRISAPANTSDHLHFRHMVLRDYETALEIFSGDLKEFPFPNTMLLPNEISSFIQSFINRNNSDYLDLSVDYRTFVSKDEVFNTYPDINPVDKSDSTNPYFYATRVPSKEELWAIADKMNPFILHFLENNIAPEEFSQSVVWEVAGGCGSGEDDIPYYHEFITFKSFWFSFLAITNISTSPIELLELIGSAQNDSTVLTNALDKSGESPFKLPFPKVALLPNQSVLVPTALILVPFNEEKFNETIIADNPMIEELRSQTLSHFVRDVAETGYAISGKYLKPQAITYNSSDRTDYSEMHELDLNNIFVLDRMWGMGSCPHLFYKRNDSRLEYVRELFTRTPGIEMTEQLVIPENIHELTIAELEYETTYITEIVVNQKILFKNIVLTTNQSIQLNVNPYDLVILKGYYISLPENVRESDKIILRNRIIGQYLRQHN